jgi:hypothetical protein
MKPSTTLFVVLLAGVALNAQGVARRPVTQVEGIQLELARVPLGAPPIKGAPYSADVITESVQMLPDGNRISRRTTGRVYRDGEGRVRREENRADSSVGAFIIDSVAGVSYALDSTSRIAAKTPLAVGSALMKKVEALGVGALTPEQLEKRRSIEAGVKAKVAGGRVEAGRVVEQHATENLDARMIEGVRAEGHRTTTIIPVNAIGNDLPITITSEEWTSPDLQVLVTTLHSDPRSGDSSYRLVNIVRAEPDASLFQIPPDYTVKETGIRLEKPLRREW